MAGSSRFLFRGRLLLATLLTGTALLASFQPAQASAALRKEVGQLAGDLKKLLDARHADSVAIGQFTGPANHPASSGPGIAQLLTEELDKLHVSIKKVAKLGVKGEYRATEIPAVHGGHGKQLAILIIATVEDELGTPVTDLKLERTIPDEETFSEVMGTTVALPPQEPLEVRNKKLKEEFINPKTSVSGSRVAAPNESRLAIEILVNGQPREATITDGMAFVRIDRGETYAVKLINDTDLEMAVRLSIDGLNMYQFSEVRYTEGPHKGEPLCSLVLVDPHSSTVINGWHKTNELSDSFLVTEYAKSAAALVDNHANLGTITATFAASWPKNLPPPPDEPGRTKGAPSPDATGFGPSVASKFETVQRNIGVLRASVSVRYTKGG